MLQVFSILFLCHLTRTMFRYSLLTTRQECANKYRAERIVTYPLWVCNRVFALQTTTHLALPL